MDKYNSKQYLYKLTFPNDMVYIGVAFDIKDRWANNGLHYRSQKVYQYIKEFGWENIKREVLLYIPHSDKNQWKNNQTIHKLERELIHAYEDRCYNQNANKSFHKKVAEQSRKKGVYDAKIFWTVNGITKPAKDWCEEYGVTYTRMKRIIDRYHILPEQALGLPRVPGNMSCRAVEYWESQGFNYFNSCRA